MRRRPLVLLVAAAQVLVPLALLVDRWADDGWRATSERGASWQMYSSSPVPRYTGSDDDGRTRTLDLDAVPALLRTVSTGRVVPDRLCRADHDLVLVRRDGGPDPGAFRC